MYNLCVCVHVIVNVYAYIHVCGLHDVCACAQCVSVRFLQLYSMFEVAHLSIGKVSHSICNLDSKVNDVTRAETKRRWLISSTG